MKDLDSFSTLKTKETIKIFLNEANENFIHLVNSSQEFDVKRVVPFALKILAHLPVKFRFSQKIRQYATIIEEVLWFVPLFSPDFVIIDCKKDRVDGRSPQGLSQA